MARHSRIDVVETMTGTGLVPLHYHPDAAVVRQVVQACYEGGARVFEFTNRGDFAHEVFAEVSRYVAQTLPDLRLGVGSVIDAGTAALYLQLGADFVVSPMLREDVARVCNRRKVLWIPGGGSLTEIAQAEEWGAEIVKVFPGGVLGPGFIKAVRGPCPWTSLMPTGGVAPTEENLRAWFDAGAACVGMGSKLVTRDLVERHAFGELTERVRATLDVIAQVRG